MSFSAHCWQRGSRWPGLPARSRKGNCDPAKANRGLQITNHDRHLFWRHLIEQPLVTTREEPTDRDSDITVGLTLLLGKLTCYNMKQHLRSLGWIVQRLLLLCSFNIDPSVVSTLTHLLVPFLAQDSFLGRSLSHSIMQNIQKSLFRTMSHVFVLSMMTYVVSSTGFISGVLFCHCMGLWRRFANFFAIMCDSEILFDMQHI